MHFVKTLKIKWVLMTKINIFTKLSHSKGFLTFFASRNYTGSLYIIARKTSNLSFNCIIEKKFIGEIPFNGNY